MVTAERPVIMLAIYCRGKRQNGERCGHMLCRVDSEVIDSDIARGIEMKCSKCGTIVTLDAFA